jgi:Ca-activated chloride channel family protein
VLPSRLDAAKRAADDFLDTVPDTINVGLVSFAGSATVVVPPTTSHDDIRRAIDDLRLGEGTAIGEAIFAGLDALALLPEASDAAEPVPASIVVLSDGETTVGRTNEEAVQAATDAEVPVSTIAFGTADGLIFLEGQAIPVPPNVDALAAIAEQTGGQTFEATDEGQLEAAYADLGSSIGFDTEQREIGVWFTGAGLAALFVAGGLSLLWFNRLP